MKKLPILLFAALLSMTAMATGCEQKEPAEDAKNYSIELAVSEFAVSEKGGIFKVDYRREAIESSADIEIRSTEDWLYSAEAGWEQIAFRVEANRTSEVRRARLEFCYEGEVYAELEVVQCAEPLRAELFETLTTADIPYRIPAITVLPDATIVCAADYRHSHKDIGVVENGRIDLHARRSLDNGVTWEPTTVIINGQGIDSEDFMNVGYGDPCLVADRDSGRVLLLSCAGNVSFQQGTRSHHQNIARFYSDDGGKTWSKPEDIAESIYSLFDKSPYGPVKAMFVASGRIMQSRTVKVADYYRLYCSVLVRDVNDNYTNYKNFVLYSDDFGGSWDVLGGTDKAAVVTADEAKVEELPDGSILISSRTTGGRHFNIYHFDNVLSGTGSWDMQTFSGARNKGVEAKDNSTNGELMLLPVVRQSDGAELHLLVQSLPLGPGRSNVGIYYKALESDSDYLTPALVAEEWDGLLQLTKLDSAYSTFALQADGSLGILWEEATHCAGGDGYTIVYGRYTVEQLTNSLYRLNR